MEPEMCAQKRITHQNGHVTNVLVVDRGQDLLLPLRVLGLDAVVLQVTLLLVVRPEHARLLQGAPAVQVLLLRLQDLRTENLEHQGPLGGPLNMRSVWGSP